MSPIAYTGPIFITAIVEAHEGIDVAVVDIPGAFLQTQASGGTIIKLQGAMVEALLRINAIWKQLVVYQDSKKVPTICRDFIQALYGILDASKLFFDDLTLFLVKDLGYIINPYDACVINKVINGKQCTISWHLDDFKLSHKDFKVVTSIIESISKKYGTTIPLSISCRKLNEYLGMTFDFTNKGEVMITMYDHIDSILEEALNIYKIGIGRAIAAPSNLY